MMLATLPNSTQCASVLQSVISCTLSQTIEREVKVELIATPNVSYHYSIRITAAPRDNVCFDDWFNYRNNVRGALYKSFMKSQSDSLFQICGIDIPHVSISLLNLELQTEIIGSTSYFSDVCSLTPEIRGYIQLRLELHRA
jgi:hypothetical protein